MVHDEGASATRRDEGEASVVGCPRADGSVVRLQSSVLPQRSARGRSFMQAQRRPRLELDSACPPIGADPLQQLAVLVCPPEATSGPGSARWCEPLARHLHSHPRAALPRRRCAAARRSPPDCRSGRSSTPRTLRSGRGAGSTRPHARHLASRNRALPVGVGPPNSRGSGRCSCAGCRTSRVAAQPVPVGSGRRPRRAIASRVTKGASRACATDVLPARQRRRAWSCSTPAAFEADAVPDGPSGLPIRDAARGAS